MDHTKRKFTRCRMEHAPTERVQQINMFESRILLAIIVYEYK